MNILVESTVILVELTKISVPYKKGGSEIAPAPVDRASYGGSTTRTISPVASLVIVTVA